MSSEWFQVDYISGLASWVFSIFLNHDVRDQSRYNVRLPIFAGNALSWLWLISSILSSVHSDIWGGRTVTWLFDRFNEERHLSDPISLGSPISLFWLNKILNTIIFSRISETYLKSRLTNWFKLAIPGWICEILLKLRKSWTIELIW